MRVGVRLGPFWLSSGGRRYHARGGVARALFVIAASFVLGGALLMAAMCWFAVQVYVAAAWAIWWAACRLREQPAPRFWAVPPLKVQ
jgi:hypothetical protein